jgi:hypothetical protein
VNLFQGEDGYARTILFPSVFIQTKYFEEKPCDTLAINFSLIYWILISLSKSGLNMVPPVSPEKEAVTMLIVVNRMPNPAIGKIPVAHVPTAC